MINYLRLIGAERRLEDALDDFSLKDDRAALLNAAVERARAGTVADIGALKRLAFAAEDEANAAAMDVAEAAGELERFRATAEAEGTHGR